MNSGPQCYIYSVCDDQILVVTWDWTILLSYSFTRKPGNTVRPAAAENLS